MHRFGTARAARAFGPLLLLLAVLLGGCSRTPPAAPNVRETAATPKLDTRPPTPLRYLPADVSGLLLVHDPLRLANALGRQQLMAEQALSYEQASAYFLRRYGMNPFHPEGWEELGLDPHGAAGVASLGIDRAFLFFGTPLSKERVKAAVYRLAQQGDVAVSVDVVGETLVLTLGERGYACLLRDDVALFVVRRPDADVDIRGLARIAAKESLAESPSVREALGRTGRGGAGLLLADLAGLGAAALGRNAAAVLFGQGSAPLVAALDTTISGLEARWVMPLSGGSLVREVLRERKSSGLALRVGQVPLHVFEAGLDFRALVARLRGLGLRGEPLELLESATDASRGELGLVVHREIVERVGTSLWQGRPLPTHLPASAEVAIGAGGDGLLERMAGSPSFGRWLRRKEKGYELDLGLLRGQVVAAPGQLQFRSGDAPQTSVRDVSAAWQHPHAPILSRLLDSKGTAFTVAVDSALLELMLVPLPGAYHGLLWEDSPAAVSADVPSAEGELVLLGPEPAADDHEAVEARQGRLEERLNADPPYQEALGEFRKASEELERRRTGRVLELVRRRFRAGRPAVLGVVRGELEDVGLVGEGALVVNTPTLRQWLPAYMAELISADLRRKEAYERDWKLEHRVWEAEQKVRDERRRIEGELEDDEREH